MTQTRRCRCIAAFALVAFIWTLALSALPGLHQRVHGDQGRSDHTCAVTFVRSGTCHHSVTPAIAVAVDATNQNATLPEVTTRWVASLFLGAAIFERAPPTCS